MLFKINAMTIADNFGDFSRPGSGLNTLHVLSALIAPIPSEGGTCIFHI